MTTVEEQPSALERVTPVLNLDTWVIHFNGREVPGSKLAELLGMAGDAEQCDAPAPPITSRPS